MGQLVVPLTVYPWYLSCSLGDYNPKIPTSYRAYIGISHDGVRWDRGTSNYSLTYGYSYGCTVAPWKINILNPKSWRFGWEMIFRISIAVDF